MYHLDPNINAAVQRQAEQVRAVRAVSAPQPEPEVSNRPARGRSLRWAMLAAAVALALVMLVGPLAVFGSR